MRKKKKRPLCGTEDPDRVHYKRDDSVNNFVLGVTFRSAIFFEGWPKQRWQTRGMEGGGGCSSSGEGGSKQALSVVSVINC